jgi:hypothetical protein
MNHRDTENTEKSVAELHGKLGSAMHDSSILCDLCVSVVIIPGLTS